jgi:hypothetical protein
MGKRRFDRAKADVKRLRELERARDDKRAARVAARKEREQQIDLAERTLAALKARGLAAADATVNVGNIVVGTQPSPGTPGSKKRTRVEDMAVDSDGDDDDNDNGEGGDGKGGAKGKGQADVDMGRPPRSKKRGPAGPKRARFDGDEDVSMQGSASQPGVQPFPDGTRFVRGRRLGVTKGEIRNVKKARSLSRKRAQLDKKPRALEDM